MRRNRIYVWSLPLILLSLSSIPVHAIVNMDDIHFKQHREDLSGSISLQASQRSGNTQSSNVSFSNQLQWNSAQHINLLVLGYEYGETNDTRSQNSSFIHGRHVRNYSEHVDYEFFSQLEKNEFTRLNYRGLIGAGLRLMVGDSENHTAYLGIGGFHEEEKTQDVNSEQEKTTRTGRWNVYLMSRYNIADHMKFSNTLYWQPSMSDTADRRSLFISNLSIRTTRQFSVQISFEVSYDSEPPTGVEKRDSQLKTGLQYSF